MIGWLVTLVIQARMSPTRNSVRFVFTSFLNETGWDNNGIVWILGLLQSAYALVGYDVVAHLSEFERWALADVMGGTDVSPSPLAQVRRWRMLHWRLPAP